MPPDAAGAPPRPGSAASRGDGDRVFVRRVLIALLIFAVGAAMWLSARVLLLLFGAVLFAIILLGLAGLLRRAIRMPEKLAVAVVVVVLLFSVAGFFAVLGSQVSQQFGELAQRLPSSAQALQDQLRSSVLGRSVLDLLGGDSGSAPQGAAAGDDQTLTQRLAGRLGDLVGWIGAAVQAVVGGIGYLLVVMLGAVYLAFEPRLYRRGLEKLVPRDREARLDEALDRTGTALWRWSAGVLATMIAVGIITTTGLWLLGVPSPLALGLIAGLLEFVPIVGPIIAAVPAILLAFTESPMLAVWTALFYVAVQQVEGNMLLPLIQREAVSLPPVVTLFAILVAGALFGTVGVLFATPLAVAAMVMVQTLYVQDALGRKVDVAGS
jgi:predicted PurR-regulated permease PerM